jgi:DnaJ-class molecular chaperone
MAQDYYQTLGVSRTASADEIRKAYKKIAKENHPDAKPGDKSAADRFKAASEAYEVLGDAEKRKAYDQFGENYKHFKPGGPQPHPGAGPIDLGDIFGGRQDIDLSDLLGGMFGGGGGGRRQSTWGGPRPQQGGDLRSSIQVSFETAAKGSDYDLRLKNASGAPTVLTVRIPPGIRDQGVIRLAGQGEPGVAGGPPGDLLVTVHVAPHPFFKREGSDLLLDVPITITEATLGAKIDVPTLLEGQVTVTIPPGTSSGARLRLRGKGFPDHKTN